MRQAQAQTNGVGVIVVCTKRVFPAPAPQTFVLAGLFKPHVAREPAAQFALKRRAARWPKKSTNRRQTALEGMFPRFYFGLSEAERAPFARYAGAMLERFLRRAQNKEDLRHVALALHRLHFS